MLHHPETTAATPRPRAPADEVVRLRRRVEQQDHALARLSDALLALRRGTEALRAENRELRVQLEARRLARADRAEPVPAGLT